MQDHVRRLVLRILKQIASLLSGDAALPDDGKCGQSLQEEREEAGKLECQAGFVLDDNWETDCHQKFGEERLYGGAQYFRALDEFRYGPHISGTIGVAAGASENGASSGYSTVV